MADGPDAGTGGQAGGRASLDSNPPRGSYDVRRSLEHPPLGSAGKKGAKAAMVSAFAGAGYDDKDDGGSAMDDDD